jgi:RNA polymerase sigma factor (TIGR02999 family)
MSTSDDERVSQLIERIRGGDDAATSELLNAAYSDLRAMAATIFGGENPGHTLQPTALVNEVCVRMLKMPGGGWNDSKHFFRTAAKAMRNVLADHARARNTHRRGSGAQRVSLDSLQLESPVASIDLISLDEAASKLAQFDDRLGIVFELRFLVGLSVEQTAIVAEISPRAVEQDSRFIRAWLNRELEP